MRWEDIQDPKNEYEFHLNWSFAERNYLPEEIQEIIDKNGVESMVHTVNEHFWLTVQFKPLRLIKQDGQKMVIENDYPRE